MKSLDEKFIPTAQVYWAVAGALLIIAESSLTIANVPHTPANFDKFEHFSVYGLLATLVGRVTAVQRWTRFGIWIAVPLVSFFGVTDEVHQHFTPGRTMEFLDWVADTTGAITAIALYRHWPRYRGWLETPVFRRQRRVENAAVVATVSV